MSTKDYIREDTIAATATAIGPGGIAITRISGDDASSLLKRIFRMAQKGGKPHGEMSSHRLYYGHIVDPDTLTVLDSALAVLMKSPHSYTGEDVAEIHSHGGYLLPKELLELCCKHGARPALPGEFTLRAFLNGKMDLAQAEAVSDVVNAETEESLRIAEEQLEGAMSRMVHQYNETILDALAEVEAQVDFPEEDINPSTKNHLEISISAVKENIEALTKTFEEGRIIKHGVKTAIVGKPNVGKSSLMNRLLMKDRAIVSPKPGTTRDFIEEPISAGGIPLRLVDTAGMRTASDDIEHAGVEVAKKKASEAELVIAVFDGSRNLDDDDRSVLREVGEKCTIVVVNKCDLESVLDERALRCIVHSKRIMRISAKTGAGIKELKEAIEETLLGRNRSTDGFVITELRHREALEKASGALSRFLDALRSGESLEFLALDLRLALDGIGEITGETTTEDLLGRIFSKFCIGK